LKPGAQIAQVAHAAIQFQHEYPLISKEWHDKSNYIVILAAKDEQDLIKVLERCGKAGLKVSVFTEPDLGNQITAIAIEPSDMTQRICSNLPLALRERKEVTV
jgi:hypothetical protein